MAEILSQSQIDELLKSLSSGETPIEEDDTKIRVKEYDFRSPKRFTREQLKIIDSIYQNFSRRLASYLSGVLRVYCEAEVLQIEEQKYYEYSNALADSVLIGNFNINYPEDDKIEDQLLLMELSKTVSFSIIDRMLGGSGEGYNYMRDYTEIELTI
ncbi:MAG: flagellar motor switch protein FliM, partial [Gracilibacteraceae bacterium]|nr:flagellar motor switch protein FliM [Gracilibacteraceae bacterium]